MRGRDQEIAVIQRLGESGVVSLQGDITYSVGRKWRSALEKLGFIYPEISKKSAYKQSDLGALDTLTPNGKRLIQAETVAGM
jgi:hypothetical protein